MDTNTFYGGVSDPGSYNGQAEKPRFFSGRQKILLFILGGLLLLAIAFGVLSSLTNQSSVNDGPEKVLSVIFKEENPDKSFQLLGSAQDFYSPEIWAATVKNIRECCSGYSVDNYSEQTTGNSESPEDVEISYVIELTPKDSNSKTAYWVNSRALKTDDGIQINEFFFDSLKL